MEGREVVLGIPDPGLAERGANPVALGRAADEQVVDVAGLVLGHLDEVAQPERAVPLRRLAPEARPLVELRQEHAQERRLQLVEARVVADELEVLLRPRSVEAQEPDALAQLLVQYGHEAAVTEREQVLRRIEAEGRGDS